jgi:predicted nucleic acid-binding protein
VISLLDNTVMSNFAAIERPDLLRTAFGSRLATSQQAFDELQAGVRLGKLPSLDCSWLPVWTLEEEEGPYYRRLVSRLNAGEAACLAMALIRNCRILTDDRDAREFARHLKIPLSGTLGVLVRLIDLGVLNLDDADALLSQMMTAGYRSPVTSLQDLV